MIEWLIIMLLSITPISELRGAIPTGIMIFGLGLWQVVIISIIFNTLAFFPIYLGLDFFYEKIKNKNFVKKIIRKTRKKGHKSMEKYGIWGLIPFVAIPLPLTGVWTATLIAWLFDIELWKSALIIFIGVLLSGTIVALSLLGVINIIW